MIKNFLPYIFLFIGITSFAQKFTRQDTLRGSITPERAWWDLQHYDLQVEVFPSEKTIKGTNTVAYTVLKKNDVMQIDLQSPMKLEKAIQNKKELKDKVKKIKTVNLLLLLQIKVLVPVFGGLTRTMPTMNPIAELIWLLPLLQV